MKERRKSERRKSIRFKAPFCIEYKNADSSQKLSGVIKNMCYGGVRVLLDASLDVSPSSLVSLTILFPGKTLKLSGKVVWTKDSGDRKEVGVYFVNISNAYKKYIYDYIFKHSEEEADRRQCRM